MNARVYGDEVTAEPVHTRSAAEELPWLGLIGGIFNLVGLLIRWLVRHPASTVTVAVGVAIARLDSPEHWWALATAILTAGVIGVLWWRIAPMSFRRNVPGRVVGAFRAGAVYRPQWRAACETLRLDARVARRQYVPRLVKVRSLGCVDELSVRRATGQVNDDWAEVADRLAATFGVVGCRVESVNRRGRVKLRMLTRDPLAEVIAPSPPSTPPKLSELPVAMREDGLPCRLRLLGTHVLVAGATGAGKGSVVWSILHAIGPAIQAGTVQVWALDPKGGIELAGGRRLFSRFCYGDLDAVSYETGFADVLEDAVQVMRERQVRLRGKTRLHTPTETEPLIVVVVDELASLTATAYMTDNGARKRIAAALSLLLSQGRAMGITVVGALQDARKENLPFRDLFPTRIGLRMTEPEQVRLVMGDGARAAGARCDEIPDTLPGVGYVAVDGKSEPARVRFPLITDDDIAAMVRDYAPGPHLVVAPDGEDIGDWRRSA